MITDDGLSFINSGGSIEFSDDSKRGKLRVKIDVDNGDTGSRTRLDADEVIQLSDWLNRLINIYEVEK